MADPLAPAAEFQRRSWAIQRLGWVAIAAWLFASAVGWIGPGAAGRIRAGAPGQRIDYDRVLHQGAPSRLLLFVEREQAGGMALSLEGAYVETFRVDDLVPGPRRQSAGGHERRFVLEIDRAGPARVELVLVPLAWGWQTGRVRVDGRPVATLRHLVLP